MLFSVDFAVGRFVPGRREPYHTLLVAGSRFKLYLLPKTYTFRVVHTELP